MTGRLTCEEAVRQFFAYLDRALEGAPLEAMDKHLEECLDCCDRLQFDRQLDAFVRERFRDEPLPEGIEARLREHLQAVRAKEGTS